MNDITNLTCLAGTLFLCLLSMFVVAWYLNKEIKKLQIENQCLRSDADTFRHALKQQQEQSQKLRDQIQSHEAQLDNPPKYKIDQIIGNIRVLERTFIPKPSSIVSGLVNLGFACIYGLSATLGITSKKFANQQIDKMFKKDTNPHCYWKYKIRNARTRHEYTIAETDFNDHKYLD